MPTEAIANDTMSEDDNTVVEIHKRLRQLLPYGSNAPMRVQPEDYGGAEVVPVIMVRKVPQIFDARVNSADGMFSKEDNMVFIHDLISDDTVGCTPFELPRRMEEKDMRAIPLQVKIGTGKSSSQCLTRVPQTTNAWHLSAAEVQAAQSRCMLMAKYPEDMFKGKDETCETSSEDKMRAPLEEPHYTLGQIAEARISLSPQLRSTLLRKGGRFISGGGGRNVLLKGVITKVEYLRGERRWKYKIPWDSHTSRSKTIAVRIVWEVTRGGLRPT